MGRSCRLCQQEHGIFAISVPRNMRVTHRLEGDLGGVLPFLVELSARAEM